MSAAKAARLIWIHGGRKIDPATLAYFLAAVSPADTREGTG